MNQVYFGNHAYGVEAASQTYFSKPAKDLTMMQAALLAGLPQAPSLYDPILFPDVARERRADVLKAMYTNGDISYDRYQSALQDTSLHLKPGQLYSTIREPYFFSYVRDQLIAKYGAQTVQSGGLRVFTTIDPAFQRAAKKAITDTLYLKDDPAAALVSINPANGAIRAMTSVYPGGAKNQFNLVAQARRQAGSTFKTFVLTQAVDDGMNPATHELRLGAVHLAAGSRGARVERLDVQPHVLRCDHGPAGDAPVRQHRLREADARRRPAERRRHGAQTRRAEPAGAGAVDRARLERSLAARHGIGVRDARRRRDLLEADGDPEGDPRQRQGGRPGRLGPARSGRA